MSAIWLAKFKQALIFWENPYLSGYETYTYFFLRLCE
ncbi:MAG: hypothetical protein KIPDCIKN_00709 [Haliscomenobacter sp.]|jgi:hypothetical protein|nr:hypothetical protein [Haliscomenobacter sp.]